MSEELKAGLEIAGFSILVLTNVAGIVVLITTVKNKLTYLTEMFSAAVADNKTQITRCDGLHDRHFSHAANTGIHQESMSKDVLALHFTSLDASIKDLSNEFAKHAKDDMEIIREVNVHLQSIRDRLPPPGFQNQVTA